MVNTFKSYRTLTRQLLSFVAEFFSSFASLEIYRKAGTKVSEINVFKSKKFVTILIPCKHAQKY